MTLDDLFSRLDGVRQRGSRWSARCPAHVDRSPSLSIKEGERGLLVKCWAGCSVADICTALGLRLADLFHDAPLPRGHRPAPKPFRVDRIARAFQFELAALDLRLRAERIIEAGKNLNVTILDNEELDHALSHAAQVYADIERAELFEGVADDLRTKEFRERDHEPTRRIA